MSALRQDHSHAAGVNAQKKTQPVVGCVFFREYEVAGYLTATFTPFTM